jgi:hypothetical protein
MKNIHRFENFKHIQFHTDNYQFDMISEKNGENDLQILRVG